MVIGGWGVLICIIIIPLLLFWVWSLFDVIQNRSMDDTNRIIAVLLIIFLGVIGSFIYLFMREPKASDRYDQDDQYDPYDPSRYK